MKLKACLIGVFIACVVVATSARAAGPSTAYKLDPQWTHKSPDGATTIEQYKKTNADDDWFWQFWARHQNTQTLLGPEQENYPAGFRFTADSKWVVRMQKTGSGESTLYLYRLGPQGFVPATKKPLADLAWAYFKSRPEWRKVKKDPEYHISANLLKGTEENYRWLDVDWPENRYLLIGRGGLLRESEVRDWSSVIALMIAWLVPRSPAYPHLPAIPTESFMVALFLRLRLVCRACRQWCAKSASRSCRRNPHSSPHFLK